MLKGVIRMLRRGNCCSAQPDQMGSDFVSLSSRCELLASISVGLDCTACIQLRKVESNVVNKPV